MSKIKDVDIWQNMTFAEIKIISQFPEGDLNVAEISKTLKKRYGYIYDNIPRLLEKGLIKETYKNRYRITKKGAEFRNLLMEATQMLKER